MTRIIAGSARGRRLRTPRGDGTRPTTDRVREALFSAWESALGSLEGTRVLDLYAGSGAVGLEAVSRGAHEVVLVEQDRRTAGVIRDNIVDLGFRDRARVVAASVGRFLDDRAADSPAYDMAFLDPPYPLPRTTLERDLMLLGERGWLAEEAIVVVERSSRTAELTWPPGYVEGRVRRYGETLLLFGSWSALG